MLLHLRLPVWVGGSSIDAKAVHVLLWHKAGLLRLLESGWLRLLKACRLRLLLLLLPQEWIRFRRLLILLY